MTKTKLRWIGAGVLLFNLWLCGNYNIKGIPLLLMTIGFAVGWEMLLVRQAPSIPRAKDGVEHPDQ